MTDSKLTAEDRERYDIIHACIESSLTNAEAAAQLHLKVRQVQNLKAAVKKYGEKGVMHGNQLRVPWNATPADTKKSIVMFLKQRDHRDFGPVFAMEQLKKQEQIVLSRESVRAIMIKEGIWTERKRKGPSIHRHWREPRALFGELVQFDGSYHDWLENGNEKCLLAAIDDATGTIMRALFDDNEGVHAVFRFWWAYIEGHGLPAAIYLDKFSTYKVNHKNAVDNAEMMTQFERAMGELGVRVICANSPQAKGRIERLFGTLQDRMVKEMRLADIKNTEDANRFLANTYVPDHNKRFAVRARQEGDAHRPLTKELSPRLAAIFSIQSERIVRNDYTLQFKNKWYQLQAQQPVVIYPDDTVTIEERLDGTIHVRFKEAYLSFSPVNKLERIIRPRIKPPMKEKRSQKPAADHPWRKAAAVAAERAAAKKLRNAR